MLMARRLVERGARFIQVYSGGAPGDWDAHEGLAANHRARCMETDAPIAGLLADLKQRGLLDSTLVIWGGEFGRLPITETKGGRDHNPYGFLMWMAGGGIKGGASVGETDELGYRAAQEPTSIHDVHATILALMGLDHTKLTFLHNGREFRLTDVSGEVIRKIIA
jgi:arylsulfatase A-like enzyme